jgi:predicted ribosome quality control (RQC) complex YloA/Tae2 family protein
VFFLVCPFWSGYIEPFGEDERETGTGKQEQPGLAGPGPDRISYPLPPTRDSMLDKTTREGDPRVYRYELPGGWIVLAGRTDSDNDRLSLEVAGPRDWWFHVRGMPGSHVILRAKPDEEPGRDLLKQAAAVAAYHSKARSGGVVAVSFTLARFVTKPGRTKPGTVQIRKERVLKVRPALPAGTS